MGSDLVSGPRTQVSHVLGKSLTTCTTYVREVFTYTYSQCCSPLGRHAGSGRCFPVQALNPTEMSPSYTVKIRFKYGKSRLGGAGGKEPG